MINDNAGTTLTRFISAMLGVKYWPNDRDRILKMFGAPHEKYLIDYIHGCYKTVKKNSDDFMTKEFQDLYFRQTSKIIVGSGTSRHDYRTECQILINELKADTKILENSKLKLEENPKWTNQGEDGKLREYLIDILCGVQSSIEEVMRDIND